MKSEITKAKKLLEQAKRIVVLTGAGISAESGVPTFRGTDGLWTRIHAEDMATLEAFNKDPRIVWKWYGERQQNILSCKPNPAHETIAKMQEYFSGLTLITQNTDGLHERAGSKNVIELHGNLFKARCMEEGTVTDFILKDDPLPKCEKCGGVLRPHVVWFGENLDPEVINEAVRKSCSCDLFIISGTSAQVQPVASLPLYAVESGAALIEINMEKTPVTRFSDVSIIGKAGEIFPLLLGK